MTWAVFALFNALMFAAYFIGKDAGVSAERQRNATRRAHRHQIAANRPRTTTRKETREP